MDFTERVPARMTVSELAHVIAGRQGLRGVQDFLLFKDSIAKSNLLSEPSRELHEIHFTASGHQPRLVCFESNPGSFWEGYAARVQAETVAQEGAACSQL